MAADSDPVLTPPPPQPEQIARSAGLAGLATSVSRLLGLARETVLAALFGAGNDMDTYLVAFRIPNLVRDLFAEGAMSAAFVPTFTRYLAVRGKADAWRLGNYVLNALLLITGAAVVAAMVFAAPLVTLYAGGFAAVPGKLEQTIQLTRIVLPFLTLAALAAAVMGMLNSLRCYFLPALSPAAFNVASILGAIALTPLMPLIGQPRIMALAIAAIVGGVGQVALQWPALRREGFRYSPVIDWRDPGLKSVLLLMGPGTLGLAATQVNLFVTTQLATSQGAGAVSWLQYAFRLMYLPIGLFGVSIGTAVLPAIARHLTGRDRRAAGDTMTRGLALMLIVNIPATVGLLVLATPIVQLLLERGRFLPSDTAATAAAVQCYAVGLVGYSAARIASPVFYALGRSRVAVGLSAISMIVNLAVSLVLARMIGFTGLAAATSLAAIVNGGLAVTLLRGELRALDFKYLAVTSIKALIGSALMAGVLLAIAAPLGRVVPGQSLYSLGTRLVLEIMIGLVTFTGAAKIMRIPDFDRLIGDVYRKLSWRRRT